MRKNKIFLVFLIFYTFFSCKEEKKVNHKLKSNTDIETVKKIALISSPENNKRYSYGDNINISLSLIDSSVIIDSTILFINDEKVSKTHNLLLKYTCDKVGKQNIKVEIWHAGKSEINRTNILVLSDISPQNITYKILNIYPHDINAYTQGLEFENGFFYEGTGEWGGRSSIRKVKPNTGKVLKIYSMLPKFFGEGIAIVQDKIFQITYKSHQCFVYDKNTFKKINTFTFSNNEGWGLTYDGKQLIMSDGSNILYFMNTDYFAEQKRVEVYDNTGPIYNINELEYINGKIYANIYQTETIVVIENNTGRIIAKANMQGLLKAKDKHPNIDVLNGIAYDKENHKTYITGKNWPKLFEIQFSSGF